VPDRHGECKDPEGDRQAAERDEDRCGGHAVVAEAAWKLQVALRSSEAISADFDSSMPTHMLSSFNALKAFEAACAAAASPRRPPNCT
jgi:hypothetical protein